MANEIAIPKVGMEIRSVCHRMYGLFAPRAHTVIIFAALIFTVGAKFYHAWCYSGGNAYFIWILADLIFLLGIELVLTLVCIRWPRAWILRFSTLLATVITTWAVINAAYLVRNGTQVLPDTIRPLFRDPWSNFPIVGSNLYRHPMTTILLLVPSFVMLGMMIRVMVKPVKPDYDRRFFLRRITATLLLLALAVPVRGSYMKQRPSQPASSGLQFSTHVKAITSLIKADSSPLTREDFLNATRVIPAPHQVSVAHTSQETPPNLVIVVLEGIQYRHTSLDGRERNKTPYLYSLGKQGVVFTSMRSVLTHTTKALFGIITGRYPSGSQDVVEAIPVEGGYASLASLLKQKGYRTQFMQSAKGSFESRPGLVQNLGFESFFAREHLNDPNAHLGYLAGDEFAMLPAIGQWLEQAKKDPFFLTILCSASHDPYNVPDWYAEPAKEPLDRYGQIIAYTDKYLQAIDAELAKQSLTENTIFCVIGDHGEGFGEHGKLGHDRIGFEEVLRVPWVIRGPEGVHPGSRIDAPVSSIDVAPTLLSLMGFDPAPALFDGIDVLGEIPADRKVFFTGWAPEGAAGYIVGQRKYIHNPAVEEIVAYDLSADPMELSSQELSDSEARVVIDQLICWRRQTIFRPAQTNKGAMRVYDSWLCRWAGRSPITKYQGVYP